MLANVYRHGFDPAPRTQKAFIGRWTRDADDFVIQCGTAEQAGRALAWTREQWARVGLRLHPTKTRVVNDREEGFDFLGFHHRRVLLTGSQKESRGVLRWPSQTACRQCREQVRTVGGPPGRRRREREECQRRWRRFLQGWKPYFRHGESTRTFVKLDQFVVARGARNRGRSQPRGKKRQRRRWRERAQELEREGVLPRLARLGTAALPARRGRAKVRGRAVEGRTLGTVRRGSLETGRRPDQGPLSVGTGPKGRQPSSRMQVLPFRLSSTAPAAYPTCFRAFRMRDHSRQSRLACALRQFAGASLDGGNTDARTFSPAKNYKRGERCRMGRRTSS